MRKYPAKIGLGFVTSDGETPITKTFAGWKRDADRIAKTQSTKDRTKWYGTASIIDHGNEQDAFVRINVARQLERR